MLANLNEDGVVDACDLQIMANDWLITDVCYPTSPPPIGPIAHWPLDIDFDDISGNGLHGDPNGASLIADPCRGEVATFDGNDYVDCGNPTDPCLLDFGTGNWTVCAWVKTTMSGTGGDPNVGVIYAKGGDHSGGHRYGVYVNQNQSAPRGRVNLIIDDNGDDGVGSSFGKTEFTGDVVVSDGEWHHVVGLRDGDDLRLYIDGLLDGTDDCAGYDLSGTHQHNAYIGAVTDNRDPNGTTLEKYLEGSVDDVRIYDYALSYGEVRSLVGLGDLHIPVPSPANIYDHPVIEPPGKQAVNFRDFAVLANYWLEEELKWPQW